MMRVYTKNGEYNITESLLESIKNNNPEILLERESAILKADGSHYNIDDNDNSNNNANDNGDENTVSDEENSEAIIVMDQLLKNGGDISNGLSVNGKTYTKQDIIDRFIRRIPQFRKMYYDFKDNQSEEGNRLRQAVNDTESLKTQNNPVDPENLQKTMQNFLDNSLLKKEIDGIESIAERIIKRCKKNIQQTVGLMGTAVLGQPSNYTQNSNAQNDNKQQNSTSGNSINLGQANDNTRAMTTTNNQSTALTVYNGSTGQNNQPNTQNNQFGVHNNKQPGYNVTRNPELNDESNLSKYQSSFGKNVKSNIQLAGGGFRISPMFNDINDKTNSGKAIKYYKANITKSKDSLIDDMIDTLIEVNNLKEEDTETLKFKNIAYNFLRNTVYKVEVNNDKLYNNVFRAIRYDDVLMDKFGVTNTSSVQLFDTKEQTVVFSDPNKNVPIAILVIFPLFAKGMEIFKKVKSLGRHFNGKG